MPGKPLAVREDPQRGVCVSGLTLHKPTSAEELLGMLEFGNNNRTQHPTDANAQSSRSHAVFQVFVRQKDRTAGLQANFTMGKMSLIDLAGSERAIVTSNRGERFREGANINKSLLALGNCINALADKENKSGHIPYRDSKLTRLLKDSLGGNCRTVMIAAVSPSGLSYEDTYNTLKYADRAMNITCKVVKNEVSVDMHVSRYAKIVEELRLEISELKKKLFSNESRPVVPSKAADSTVQTEEIQRLCSSLKSVMKERMAVRRNIIDVEAAERDLQMKLYRKERSLKRLQFVCVEGQKLNEALSKAETCQSATKSKQKYLISKKSDFEEQIAKNTKWLDRIKSEMTHLDSDVGAKTQLEQCQSVAQSQLDNMELKRSCQLYKKHIHALEKDAQSTERLVEKLLGMVQKQFLILKGVGLTTQELTDEYNNIIETVEKGREVTWADQSTLNDGNSFDKTSFNISFQLPTTGTPVSRTPIRKRQFNTPVSNIVDMTPCRSTSKHEKIIRTTSQPTLENSDTGTNTCISLTREYEITQSLRNVIHSMEGECERQKTATPGVTGSIPKDQKLATPLRVPSAVPFLPLNSNNVLMSPAMFHNKNGANKQSTSVSRKATPHPKVCWSESPVETKSPSPTYNTAQNNLGNISPVRVSTDLNLSGIQALDVTPADKNPQKDVRQITPPLRNCATTPLKELSVNTANNLKDQLPSVLSQSNLLKQEKSNCSKEVKNMLPKRVFSATKENVQALRGPSRSSSALQLDKLHSKKVKKHFNGLRRAMSSTTIGAARNFAPRTSPKRGNSRSFTDRPRWQ